VRVWNLAASSCITEVAAHFSNVTAIVFSANGEQIFSYVEVMFTFSPTQALCIPLKYQIFDNIIKNETYAPFSLIFSKAFISLLFSNLFQKIENDVKV